jgi:hypothetical protein
MKSRVIVAAVPAGLLATAAGCSGGPYRIRDTANTNNTYYAKKVKRYRDGTIGFTDARTGAKVTLQSSTVEKIPKDEWNGAVKGGS